MERYRHRPAQPAESDFEELCRYLLQDKLGETVRESIDRKSQVEIGDTLEGDEFKYLKNSTSTLRIEIAEKVDPDQERWIPSGIMCNRKRYICGNMNDIFAFTPEALRQWRIDNNPKAVFGYVGDKDKPTICSFELPKDEAKKICLFRLMLLQDESWLLWRSEVAIEAAAIPSPHVCVWCDKPATAAEPLLDGAVAGISMLIHRSCAWEASVDAIYEKIQLPLTSAAGRN